MATPDDIAGIIEKAAALIEPQGAWCQGEYNSCGSFCAIGAILEAAGSSPAEYFGTRLYLREEAAEKAIFLVAETVPDSDIAEWNDDPRRKQHEVVTRLREVAAAARAKVAA